MLVLFLCFVFLFPLALSSPPPPAPRSALLLVFVSSASESLDRLLPLSLCATSSASTTTVCCSCVSPHRVRGRREAPPAATTWFSSALTTSGPRRPRGGPESWSVPRRSRRHRSRRCGGFSRRCRRKNRLLRSSAVVSSVLCVVPVCVSVTRWCDPECDSTDNE